MNIHTPQRPGFSVTLEAHLLTRCRSLSIPATAVEIRPGKTQVVVHITLSRTQQLNALYATEQFIVPDVLANLPTFSEAIVYWRYLPPAIPVAAANGVDVLIDGRAAA